MKTFNLVGDTFTHLTNGNKGYSVHSKIAENVRWVQDWSSDETFYMDSFLYLAVDDTRSKKKYAWLYESPNIVDIVFDVINRPDYYLDIFDLIFTHNKTLIDLDDRFLFCPANGFWIEDARVYDKTRLVSMIASNKRACEGHLYRLGWVEKLKDKLDLYGRGFNEIGSKDAGLCDYMFSVAIENGRFETYFTEKLLDCFATGTIPIYYGAPDVGTYFNLEGIIELTDDFDPAELSEGMYYNKLKAVEENLEIVKTMEIPEDYIFEKYFI